MEFLLHVGNILVWAIHLTWPLWPFLFLRYVFKMESYLAICIVIGVGWAVTNIIFSGCPFSYVHEWFALELGFIDTPRYNIKESIFYKLFLST